MKTTAFALLVLAAVACGSTDSVEPTPDVPRFADGEAVALVKERIIAELRGPRSFKCIEEVYEAKGEFLRGTTTASYLGDGVWWVTSDPFSLSRFETTTMAWKVYEFSGVVEPANEGTVSTMGC